MFPRGRAVVMVDVEHLSFLSKPSLPTFGQREVVYIRMSPCVSGWKSGTNLLRLELSQGMGVRESAKVHLTLTGVGWELIHVKRILALVREDNNIKSNIIHLQANLRDQGSPQPDKF